MSQPASSTLQNALGHLAFRPVEPLGRSAGICLGSPLPYGDRPAIEKFGGRQFYIGLGNAVADTPLRDGSAIEGQPRANFGKRLRLSGDLRQAKDIAFRSDGRQADQHDHNGQQSPNHSHPSTSITGGDMQPHFEMPGNKTAPGLNPFDKDMAIHPDETKGFGRFDRNSFHLADDAEQKRQAQRMMLIGGVLIGSIFWAAIMLFIAFDPQQRIHAALEAQLYGENV